MVIYVNEQTHITAIYGGAFDPVHLGHIKIALHILAQPEISQLRLLPCYLHPDKNKPYATSLHRCNMLKLIARESLTVDPCELNRKGVSYTADTAKYLRKTLGAEIPLALVLGLDTYTTINSWQNAEQLPSLLNLIVVARPKVKFEINGVEVGNSDWQSVDTLREMTHHTAGMVHFMSEPLIDISSSQIRTMIARGVQPRYQLPGVVWNYIKRNQLYDYQEPA